MFDARQVLTKRWRQRMALRNAVPVADVCGTRDAAPSTALRAPLAIIVAAPRHPVADEVRS